jgi:hypothetical protein
LRTNTNKEKKKECLFVELFGSGNIAGVPHVVQDVMPRVERAVVELQLESHVDTVLIGTKQKKDTFKQRTQTSAKTVSTNIRPLTKHIPTSGCCPHQCWFARKADSLRRQNHFKRAWDKNKTFDNAADLVV